MDHKTCRKCGEAKPLEEFHKRAKSKDGHQAMCRGCVASRDRDRWADPEERVRLAAGAALRRDEWRVWLRDQKSHPCTDCGQTFSPAIMQFDHVPGRGAKSFEVNIDAPRDKERVLAEIAKCDLVCSNCHDYRTLYRMGAVTAFEYTAYQAGWSTSPLR